MIVIDGRMGEGGGQVLRTSLSLSALTGRPFRLEHIRGNRSRPGLRPQHLTAVRAAAVICGAEIEGDAIDSVTLVFHPGSRPQAGDYSFDVRRATSSGHSAGSATLIFQTILWPLLYAGEASRVTINGGTFVPFSPPFHYLSQVARPAFERFGARFEAEIDVWGWMAAGGGQMKAHIEPVGQLEAAVFTNQRLEGVGGIAAVTNLPSHIPHRMARRAHNMLAEAGFQPAIQVLRARGPGPGAGMILWLSQAGFSSLGRKGLASEEVARAAVADLLSFAENGAAVDPYLADQLLVPMALAQGESAFTTNRLTRHTMTNADLLRRWLDVKITFQGALDGPGKVEVRGVGLGLD